MNISEQMARTEEQLLGSDFNPLELVEVTDDKEVKNVAIVNRLPPKPIWASLYESFEALKGDAAAEVISC